MADMMMPEGMPMDPMMGGGMPPAEGMPMDPMMGGGMPPMDMLPPEGEAPMEAMGDELADEGRGSDQIVGHLTPGEVVIPVEMMDDELSELLDEFFAENGLSMGQYTVGNEENSINPETGMPEFFFGSRRQGRFNDPRRNWADAASYFGYTGTESGQRKDTRVKEFGISQADYNRFNEYMQTYRDKQAAATEVDLGDLLTSLGVTNQAPFGGNVRKNAYMDAIQGGNRYNYSWMNDPDFKKAVELGKQNVNQTFQMLRDVPSWMRPRNENTFYAQQRRLAEGRKKKAYDTMIANVRAGKQTRIDYSMLSDVQKAGPWQHAERYSDTWNSMDEGEKKRIFEDFMKVVQVEKAAPYAGMWAGAAKGYGDKPSGGYASTDIMGNPYIPMDEEAQAAYDVLAPEEIEYRTASQEGSEQAMIDFMAEQEAQQEAYLEQMRAQLEAERVRAAEERKRALTKQARLNRLKVKEGGQSQFSNTAAAEAVGGSVADPRSMVARSYSRRATFGGSRTLTGFRAAGSSGMGSQRPS